MTDDIIKQAELRHQRRPRAPKDKENGDIGYDLQGNKDRRPSFDNDFEMISPRDRPKASRRRNDSFNEGVDGLESSSVSCLPFIRCKVEGTDVKALLNTSVPVTLIQRQLLQRLRHTTDYVTLPFESRGTSGTQLPIVIDGVNYTIKPKVEDNIPDLVIGVDFLHKEKCSLDFASQTLTIRDNAVNFLSDHDVPLRYKGSLNLAASI